MTQYEELKKENTELQARVDKIEKSMVYDCIDKNMPKWAHEPVQWCMDKGIVNGTDDSHLNLNDTKLWVCAVVYRAVKFVAGLFKVKI